MKAIKHTNLKTLTVLAALLLLTASLAIPIQESSAEKEKKGKDYDGEKEKKGKDYDGEKEKNYDSIKQMNECSDSVIACINIICQAAEVCIIPQDSFTRIALPI
jgi:Rps23 Pro-64 3,4-dihydroxylase Tpa1-like proline 4-hydroxylase